MGTIGPGDRSDWDPALCDFCGGEIGRAPWVLFNRYGVGTGTNSRYTRVLDDDGECLWDPDARVVTADLVHLSCVVPFLEGQMIETDFDLREGASDA